MVSRADRSQFADWWWTVDRPLLGGVMALMVGGIVLSLAGSPAVAERLGYDSFHFVNRHLFFFLPALAVMLATSFLSARQARRVALVILGISLALMLAVLIVGVENNGSRRWINIAGVSIQPSEFMKPAFVVICAWLFSENSRRGDIPGNIFALILLVIVAALLVAQPDFGQTMLVAVVWGAIFFMAGLPWLWIVMLGCVAVGGVFTAYAMLPHVAGRINRFLAPHSGDTFQVDTAMNSIANGGWLGRGPGEGTVKRILPDAHTDFIFAVAAEEFGIIICIGLVLIFAFVVLRGLSNSQRSQDSFTRLASAGLVVLFGVQAVINIGVNLSILPAKGMTLPFISYGGSSALAMAICVGMLLSLTREHAGLREAV